MERAFRGSRYRIRVRQPAAREPGGRFAARRRPGGRRKPGASGRRRAARPVEAVLGAGRGRGVELEELVLAPLPRRLRLRGEASPCRRGWPRPWPATRWGPRVPAGISRAGGPRPGAQRPRLRSAGAARRGAPAGRGPRRAVLRGGHPAPAPAAGRPRALPCVHIEDWPSYPVRGIMLDVSRDRVPTMQTLRRLLDLWAGLKYNQVAAVHRAHLRLPGSPGGVAGGLAAHAGGGGGAGRLLPRAGRRAGAQPELLRAHGALAAPPALPGPGRRHGRLPGPLGGLADGAHHAQPPGPAARSSCCPACTTSCCLISPAACSTWAPTSRSTWATAAAGRPAGGRAWAGCTWISCARSTSRSPAAAG